MSLCPFRASIPLPCVSGIESRSDSVRCLDVTEGIGAHSTHRFSVNRHVADRVTVDRRDGKGLAGSRIDRDSAGRGNGAAWPCGSSDRVGGLRRRRTGTRTSSP
jgi:hypothetical protein